MAVGRERTAGFETRYAVLAVFQFPGTRHVSVPNQLCVMIGDRARDAGVSHIGMRPRNLGGEGE